MRSSQIQSTSTWLQAFCDRYRSCVFTHGDSASPPLAKNGSLAVILCLYNFEVKYKPGKQNALADALSRRPDYELAHVTTLSLLITDLVRVLCYKAVDLTKEAM